MLFNIIQPLQEFFHQTPMRCIGLNIENTYRLIFYLNPDAKHAVQHYTTLTGFFSLVPNAMHGAQYRKALQACLIPDKRLKAFPISTQGLPWGASYNI